MPGDELRMAFVLASQTPSSRAEESGSRPPSMKHRSDEVRGAGAWRHRHLEREWFAHTDGRMLDIMMSRSARRTPENTPKEVIELGQSAQSCLCQDERGKLPRSPEGPELLYLQAHWYSRRWVRRHLLREDCGLSSVVVARDLACPRSLAYFSAPGVLYFSR